MFFLFTLNLFACSSSQISLSGEAKEKGDPAVFIQLCEQQNPTAIALKVATQRTNCDEAGDYLATVTTVDFNRSTLETVDLKPLTQLTNLQSILAYDKNISDISPLADLLLLKDLSLMKNNISDIRPLAKLGHLKHLRLDGNQISDITTLKENKKLERLGLDSNQISDFRPIAHLPHLQDLNTNFNPVDLDKCPIGPDITLKLNKYCKRLKKNEVDAQDALDPKQ